MSMRFARFAPMLPCLIPLHIFVDGCAVVEKARGKMVGVMGNKVGVTGKNPSIGVCKGLNVLSCTYQNNKCMVYGVSLYRDVSPSLTMLLLRALASPPQAPFYNKNQYTQGLLLSVIHRVCCQSNSNVINIRHWPSRDVYHDSIVHVEQRKKCTRSPKARRPLPPPPLFSSDAERTLCKSSDFLQKRLEPDVSESNR